MEIENAKLYDFFRSRGINFLYHANTVATSITFLENGGLLSRGTVEALGLYQTEQESDSEDKTYGVWNDIFLDTKDLHGYFPRQNLYGPILFVFKSELILNEAIKIQITKENPIYWYPNQPHENRYFTSISDVIQNWNKYDTQKKMVTISNINTPILFDHFEQMIVDKAYWIIDKSINLDQECITAINHHTINNSIFNGKIISRNCANKICYCKSNYYNSSDYKLAKLFLPKDHKYFSKDKY